MFKNNEKGFTLIELLIAVFIIGVITAMTMPNLKASGEKAQEKSCDANQKLIKIQLENYYLEKNSYPTVLDVEAVDADGDGIEDFLVELYKEKMFDHIPECPSGGTYTFKPDAEDPIISGGTTLEVRCSEHTEGHTTETTSS